MPSTRIKIEEAARMVYYWLAITESDASVRSLGVNGGAAKMPLSRPRKKLVFLLDG